MRHPGAGWAEGRKAPTEALRSPGAASGCRSRVHVCRTERPIGRSHVSDGRNDMARPSRLDDRALVCSDRVPERRRRLSERARCVSTACCSPVGASCPIIAVTSPFCGAVSSADRVMWPGHRPACSSVGVTCPAVGAIVLQLELALTVRRGWVSACRKRLLACRSDVCACRPRLAGRRSHVAGCRRQMALSR